MILCLETATNLCSVALCGDAGVISLKESRDEKSHSSMLTVFIKEILKENDLKPADLQAVAVSKGPGSYTGLRIGVSVAKGIAYAANVPLIGIETTYSMYWGIAGDDPHNSNTDSNTLFCPMLDARRMEVYYAIYDRNGMTVKNITAEIITEDSFRNIPESNKIVFFGEGSGKLRDVIKRPNIHFETDFRISSKHMCKPSLQSLHEKKFEDVAYFEPLYLKNFITTVPKKNILGR